jgi:hypothetical protein
MYDPSIGRWLSEDPIGFAGGDVNLYRYVHNDPTTFTDPSGLEETEIGGRYHARIQWVGNNWTPQQRARVRLAFYNASVRINNALVRLQNWDQTTRDYSFTLTPDGRRIPQPTWAIINQNRLWLMRGLRAVYDQLTSGDTVIPVSNRLSETHPERNPMYTSSIWLGVTEVNRQINLRSHFWQLSLWFQGFWTDHEFARYFLLMGDDRSPITVTPVPYSADMVGGVTITSGPPGRPYTVNRPGVQTWDRCITWLNNTCGIPPTMRP